jgi:hypothetical protein
MVDRTTHITNKGKAALELLGTLHARTKGKAEAEAEAKWKSWAEGRVEKLLASLRKSVEKGNTYDEYILLFSMAQQSFKKDDKLRVRYLGEQLGIPLVGHVKATNMGGGDPREQDDWYAEIKVSKLTELLRNAST